MFQVQIEDSLLRGDASHLVSVLHLEGLSSTTLTRLDQLVTKDLCRHGFSRVLGVLKSLEILSAEKDDLQTLVDLGLTTKVLLWFEAVHNLLTSDLHKSPAPLLSLTEKFCDYFLLLAQASLPDSQLSSVLLHLSQFSLEPEIHFPLRLEAIRTFNSILESLGREQRRQIQNDQNQNQILSQLAAALFTVGDYELQVSLSEALCRLTPRKERLQRANQWFSSRDISNAFCDIRDGDFEVDCRRFLNIVNCYHEDQRRVYTFPCLRAYLDSTQLFPPKEDKLDEFWIDFNIGSGCVSFFIDEPQGFLWGSIHLLREDVDQYSLQVKHGGCTGAETVLSVQLINPIIHNNIRGQTVQLSFSCEHQRDLENATGRVFMALPPAHTPGVRCYSRKKAANKSHLKILPVSSPSSEDDSGVMKTPGKSRAEFLFDQITHSTPRHRSGVSVGAEPELSQEKGEEIGGSDSSAPQDVLSSDRKRTAAESGYLSDLTEGAPAQRRRVVPQPEGEESHSAVTGCSPEGAGLSPEEEGLPSEGLGDEEEEPVNKLGAGPEPDLVSGITATFKTFRAQLEQHFTESWRSVENQVLQSLQECQQQVSSLFTAVSRHRSLLLQMLENSIGDQLHQLDQSSTNLKSQILSFFHTETQRLGSFCDEHLQRLKHLENGELESPSSQ